MPAYGCGETPLWQVGILVNNGAETAKIRAEMLKCVGLTIIYGNVANVGLRETLIKSLSPV